MKMQRARTNNIARERAITEKTVTSFRSIKVRLIESLDFPRHREAKGKEVKREGKDEKQNFLHL